MTDGDNTQQTLDPDDRVAECEPHVVHLLPGERELLAECHRHGVYLAQCGAVLAVSELASSECEPGCERLITYCAGCLDDAARWNAEAGVLPTGAWPVAR